MDVVNAPLPSSSTMQTSNFAHVIFQNVAKSYLPHAPLECHYTLTPYIKPHQKDWVGIFKVGWSTARDYYTFLWSQVPENYAEGISFNRVIVFQGYYLPNDDGEFYQFCYVTHKGEIRGASTPFQFRVPSPTDDLLTMEDDTNSDMLVVTTKTSFLEQRIEVLLKEKEELLKTKSGLEEETVQLGERLEKFEKEIHHEKEVCDQIKKDYKDLFQCSEASKVEKEDIEKKYKEAAAKITQLEEDIVTANEKAIAKETELDSIKHKLRRLIVEKEQLELQLKNEKDEKELYKVHAKNTEIENTKLVTEMQSFKNLDASKENMLAHFKEEVGRLQQCLSEKEKLQKELLVNSSNMDEVSILRERLRRAEEHVQASEQKIALMAQELADTSNIRDKTMGDLHSARIKIDLLKEELADTENRYKAEIQVLRSAISKKERGSAVVDSTVEQELHKEVEDLKLRLQMAAEHYKEKYKDCQKLQKQVVKLTEQLEEKKNETFSKKQKLTDNGTNTESPPVSAADFIQDSSPVMAAPFDHTFDLLVQTQISKMSKEITEKTEKYKKCKQMLAEENERSHAFAEELAYIQQKLNQQLKINNDLKQEAAEDIQYKVLLSEKEQEVKELKAKLAIIDKEKEILEELNKEFSREESRHDGEEQNSQSSKPQDAQQILQYPNPYSSDPPIVPVKHPGLQFGDPYAETGRDGALYLDEIHRMPRGVPSWGLDSTVVCSQPSRNFSRPDGLEDPDELINDEDESGSPAGISDPPGFLLQERGAHFCFNSSLDLHKKCPLCDVVFPPNYDQSKFEEHVESHWKVCPMCNEQFPPDCDQHVFEKHVMTHFPESVQSFD
ncbi:tax1-binding protein 1 homolog B [Carcharodon carcharias]|uniref:tax1-binding protein 1 homolog B n=1 Tax=Carcharodon carcharias TaxID=13397 RepID=UPI001B7F1FAB|nr:tax1-binding protein 1 homolog B [Carcharodon carcharias]XP_041039679.1 tax1-binding protein 1 homolog B [Carcharodon carcharias]